MKGERAKVRLRPHAKPKGRADSQEQHLSSLEDLPNLDNLLPEPKLGGSDGDGSSVASLDLVRLREEKGEEGGTARECDKHDVGVGRDGASLSGSGVQGYVDDAWEGTRRRKFSLVQFRLGRPLGRRRDKAKLTSYDLSSGLEPQPDGEVKTSLGGLRVSEDDGSAEGKKGGQGESVSSPLLSVVTEVEEVLTPRHSRRFRPRYRRERLRRARTRCCRRANGRKHETRASARERSKMGSDRETNLVGVESGGIRGVPDGSDEKSPLHSDF